MALPSCNLGILPTRYIFDHVPKTGGTSLLAIIQHNLASSQIKLLREEELRVAPVSQFERYTVVAGHFRLSSFARISAGRYSIKLLREPVRRIFSLYTFWRQAQEDAFVTAKAKELLFADWVRYFAHSPTIILNVYTHHFAGVGLDFPKDNSHGPALLAAAKHNLSAFDFVGICEEYERSVRLLCGELGWHAPVPLPHENRSGSQSELADIDEETLVFLRERNQLDFELYAYGISLFQARESAFRGIPASLRGHLPLEGGGPNQWTDQWPKPKSFLPFSAPSEPDRKARIEAVSAAWLPDRNSQVLQRNVRFRTKVEIPELILGVIILDAAGNSVWGTNTQEEGLDLQNDPGCDCCATFVLQCEAPVGTYSVTAALHRPREWGFHEHWLDQAACFEVVAQAGPVDPRSFKLLEFRSRVCS